MRGRQANCETGLPGCGYTGMSGPPTAARSPGQGLTPMDDRALVEALQAGDPQAPRLLVERFQGVLFGLCLRMMGHRQDAEDVMQESFLRALRGVAGFVLPGDRVDV